MVECAGGSGEELGLIPSNITHTHREVFTVYVKFKLNSGVRYFNSLIVCACVCVCVHACLLACMPACTNKCVSVCGVIVHV